MKHRIRKLFSLTLALSMLLSMIPLGISAELVDEFAEYETLDEIPFEFELEPGDLPFEQLKDAVLAAEDIPACIDPALAEARGHVNRLYLQEPDDNTVTFQNRDGSKTVYVFSHPVKGMTMTTTASIQVNGSVISFSGTNAISSRIAELSNYNIGYSEVAYIPNGVLSADGIDLTEDARGWARGESMPSSLAYNISGEAAAEYAASISVPYSDVAGIAAVAPGVTITPNDPAPLGGMTVMSISYSDLAGLMSFKNTSTNKFLTLRPSPTYALLSSANIIVPLSRWIVSYDSGYGYTVTNLYQPANNYLGLDENNNVTVSSLNNAESAFTIQIVSTNDSKVVISVGNKAINSSLSVYSNDPSAASFPTSCEWIISSKTDCDLVEFIDPEETVRTENAGDIFYCEYTTVPTVPTYSDIEMYFASNDQTLPNDSDYDLDDSKAYYISDTGTYTVYYKDNCTGVRSANFTLQIVEYVTGIGVPSSVRIEQKNVGFELDYSFTPTTSEYHSISLYYADTDAEVPNTGDTYTISTAGVYTVYYKDSYSGVESEEFTIEVYDLPTFDSKDTYMIQPVSHSDLYLTMENDSNSESNSLTLTAINYQPITYTNGAGPSQATANLAEDWDYISKTFTIESVVGNPGNYRISATLTTNQYGAPTLYNDYINGEYMYEYQLRTLDSNGITNTLYYHNNNLCTKEKNNNYSQMSLWYVDGYYYILCGTNASSELLALKCVASSSNSYSIVVAPLIPGDASFQWTFTHVGVDVPLIKQTRNYVCGYTTLLQVMMGAGLDVTVNPNWTGTNGDTELDLDAKMKMIANEVFTVKYKAEQKEMVGYVSKLLSNKSSILTGKENVNQVICGDLEGGNNISNADLAECLLTSMETGFAPFFLTRTPYSPYKYDDGDTAHYVAIAGIKYSNDGNNTNDFVILSNCHFNENVFGVYVVSFSDFRNGWLYKYSTDDTPHLYVFDYATGG